MAFVISPEYLIPPSAITGTPVLFDMDLQFIIAVICGVPIPATILVVHIEPGPTPILTPSAPAFIRSSAPFPVATFPAITSMSPKVLFIFLTELKTFLECP